MYDGAENYMDMLGCADTDKTYCAHRLWTEDDARLFVSSVLRIDADAFSNGFLSLDDWRELLMVGIRIQTEKQNPSLFCPFFSVMTL